MTIVVKSIFVGLNNSPLFPPIAPPRGDEAAAEGGSNFLSGASVFLGAPPEPPNAPPRGGKPPRELDGEPSLGRSPNEEEAEEGFGDDDRRLEEEEEGEEELAPGGLLDVNVFPTTTG